jgi:hypothetical protein
VPGEYSADLIQVGAACMTAGMTIEQAAEFPFAFPTFTEGSVWPPKRSAGAWVSDISPVYGATSDPILTVQDRIRNERIVSDSLYPSSRSRRTTLVRWSRGQCEGDMSPLS